jgi:hypothetical protein
MQYQLVVNEKGERLWLPIVAGAAILSAPFWLNRPNNCCNNNYYPPYQYQQPIYYPQPYPQPYPYPYPLPYPRR